MLASPRVEKSLKIQRLVYGVSFFVASTQPFTVQFCINSRTLCTPVVLLNLFWSAEGVDMPMLGNYSISEKWKNIDISSKFFLQKW
jgi:hypothetical protein